MSRTVEIVTPENAKITLELGGFGSRTVAYVVDWIIITACLVAALVAVIGLLYVAGALDKVPGLGSVAQDVVIAIGITAGTAYHLIAVGYFTLYEGRRNGQTPGKRMMGLRVVRDEGSPIDMTSAVIRNLIRVVELMTLPVICLVSVMASPEYKRVGDYAAGTMVVKEKSAPVPETPRTVVVRETPSSSSDRATPAPAPQAVITPEAAMAESSGLLTKEEMLALRRLNERMVELDPSVREVVARQIAEPIMARLGIPAPEHDFSYVGFAREMLRSHEMGA